MELAKGKNCIKTSFHDSFYFFAFEFAPQPEVNFGLCFAEKISLIGIVLVLLFSAISQENIKEFCSTLTLISLMDGSSLLYFGTVLAVVVLLACGLLAVRVLYMNSKSSATKVLDFSLSFFLNINFRLITQFLTISALLALCMLKTEIVYPDYKNIKGMVRSSSLTIYISCLTFCILGAVASLLCSALYIVLYQTKKLVLWCAREWEMKFLDLSSKLVLFYIYFLDANDELIFLSSLIMLSLFTVKIVLRHTLPLPPDMLLDLADQFFDSCIQFFELILCLSNISSSYELEKIYQYAVMSPFFASLVCWIRYIRREVYYYGQLKNDDESLEYVRKVILLGLVKQEYESVLGLSGFLANHFSKCTKLGCKCKTLLKSQQNSMVYNLELDKTIFAFENRKRLPDSIKHSWKVKTLDVLFSEVKPTQSTYALQLALAEVQFYFLGNYYQALTYVQNVELANFSFISSQSASNIRHAIDVGMKWSEKENKRLDIALDFMSHYNLFISQLEDLTESNVKFWTSVSEDTPDLEKVLTYGKTHYEQRFAILNTISHISKLSDRNLDFLLKYGLFMKVIVQDHSTASGIFQRILWISESERAGILQDSGKLYKFTNEEQVMVVIVSLEQNSLLSILDMNFEVEVRLGFKKSELIKYSATKFMPSIIARQHHNFIKNFFQTMKATSLGVEKPRFIKHKNETILMCNTLKKIIPGLSEGFRGVLLLREDCTMRAYTGANADHVPSHTGAFMCDTKWKILELTHEVSSLFCINEEGIQNLRDSLTLLNVIPELEQSEVRSVISTNQGGVLKVLIKNFKFENDNESEEADKAILLWVRLVEEKYGDKSVYILIFSPINSIFVHDYLPIPDYDNLLYERKIKLLLLPRKEIKRKLLKVEDPQNKIDLLEFSDSNSISSSVSSLSSEKKSHKMSQKAREVAQELQETTMMRETPPMIKKFSALLGFSLLITLTLIAVETAQFYITSSDLTEHFDLIENFHIRYELLCYTSNSANSYTLYRKADDSANFEDYCSRANIRSKRIQNYNYLTLKGFEKMGANYDSDLITIISDSGNFSASINYLLTTFLYQEQVFLKIDNYKTAQSCINNYVDSQCIENNNSLEFSTDNGATIRNSQNRVSQILINDLLDLSNSGKVEMYLIISVCIGIVLLSSVFLFIMLIWVIKGKSKVLSVFADVSSEDIKRIIYETKSISISTINYKPSFLARSENF